MTPQQTRVLLPVIEAFANGKTIQVRLSNSTKWEDAENMNFGLDTTMYRIKPEKELVPFDFKDAFKHMCVDVIVKGGSMVHGQIHIVSVGVDGVYLKKKENNLEWFVTYEDLLSLYLFSPTEPCGKYITRD